MGKTQKCLEMLQLLNSGRIYKVSELSNLLNTQARNVIEYKKELEEIGYYISSFPGKNGGYKLEKSSLIPAIKLTEKEKKSLIEAYNYILAKKDFIFKNDFQCAMSKVISNTTIEKKDNNLLVVDKYKLSMNEEEIQERYSIIEDSINKKKVIKIKYNSLKNGLKEHTLHPYKLFIYNNSWFFLAWNPEVGDVWYFKVNRIENIEQLELKFTVWKNFDENKYFDEFGMSQNGDYYHIELIASRKRAMLMKERVYGKNQLFDKINDNDIKVSLDMQNKDMILSFILSCGNDVKVLSPEWLINDIKNKLEEISQLYTKITDVKEDVL